MNPLAPPNAADVRQLAEARLAAVSEEQGLQETVTIEWRGQQRPVQVITMPVNVLSYNPGTHRVRAQRSLDPVRDRELDSNPFGEAAQAYLHHLLMGDPADPKKVDPAFEALKEDLRLHGQNEPGIITRDGVLINANTRCAALRELGQEHIRVGVLPTDAGIEDIQSIELSLQLRRDHKRDYSFVNFLLAVDERVVAGRPVAEIQRDFRIKAATFERSRWILTFIREAIKRSETLDASGQPLALRLVDFETDKGKLEELHRSYTALKAKSPEDAEALREQRLLAVALGKSKTDVRLIEADFAERYMKDVLPKPKVASPSGLKIPGTTISVAGPSQKVETLRTLTDQVLQARAVELGQGAATPAAVAAAHATLKKVDEALDVALTQAGKQGRVIKKRFAAADRLSDANEALELSHSAVADARSTSNFNPEDLEDALVQLRANVVRLAQLVTRGNDSKSDGVSWLRAVASMPDTAS
ncbi:transcriptional regulator [Geodermatophilus amargosae]|uniref:transcriptional regulator n=1 Tax=Geodermatophilus amargosae TaxID=1296565 RepID=UPI0034DEECEB